MTIELGILNTFLHNTIADPSKINYNFTEIRNKVNNLGVKYANSGFSVLNGSFVQPAVDATVQITVINTGFFQTNEIIAITNGGFYEIISIDSGTTMTIKNLGYSGNAAQSTTIPNASIVIEGSAQAPQGIENKRQTAVNKLYMLNNL